MKCMKAELLAILPQSIRGGVDPEEVLEVRLRLDRPAALVTMSGLRTLEGCVTEADLKFTINAASRYSPWNAATMKDGYLTASGGHRIGVCGDGAGEGLRSVTSLCIRVARDVPDAARGVPGEESLLILGPPGSGKTTLLRDLIRRIGETAPVAVVDERRELFPEGFRRGKQVDVLTGVDKSRGIDMVLRSMGPRWIAMDEVTQQRDCEALRRACWCGVKLLATAHAISVRDLASRPVYLPLARSGLFRRAVVMDECRRWRLEEVAL